MDASSGDMCSLVRDRGSCNVVRDNPTTTMRSVHLIGDFR